jgi:hypothetical protein
MTSARNVAETYQLTSVTPLRDAAVHVHGLVAQRWPLVHRRNSRGAARFNPFVLSTVRSMA